MYGARLIDSIPPATIVSPEPARIASRAIATAFIPLAHTLFTVTAPIRSGSPARSIAWRAGACPSPALITFPMITSSTSLPWIPARLTASAIALDPSFTASTFRSARPYLPIGVRHALAITPSVTDPTNGGIDAPRDNKCIVEALPRPRSSSPPSAVVDGDENEENENERACEREPSTVRRGDSQDGGDDDENPCEDPSDVPREEPLAPCAQGGPRLARPGGGGVGGSGVRPWERARGDSNPCLRLRRPVA